MGSANKPTAWEVAITTVERDLAASDVDLPPLFYATQTLRYLPIADIQNDEVVSTWLSFIADLPVWPNPGRLGQYEAALAWSTDPASHDPLARDLRALPRPRLRARRGLAARQGPSGGRRSFRVASTARSPAPATSAS